MNTNLISIYRSPGSHCDLVLKGASSDDDEIVRGSLVASDGSFPIEEGIPDFTWPKRLSERERATIEFYDGRADVYDKYLPLTFSTFGEQEVDVRNAMVDRLGIGPGKRVLEIGAGTGRDSEIIAARLGGSGELFCQDITRSMLERNRDRLTAAGLKAHFAIANASHLPFEDNVFDAVFQFGGVGEFVNIAAILPGSRAGHEDRRPCRRRRRKHAGLASSDRPSRRFLATTNPQFNAPLPLEHLPIEARDVNLRWIIGGAFYLIDFAVGEGEPPADFDFAIPGPRGGTHRTRYLGQLEGVKPETKELAHKAREKLGLSMHDWLDELGREGSTQGARLRTGGMADEAYSGWRKHGLVFRPSGQGGWMNTHAQVPTALLLDDRIRVYIASRPKPGLSLTGYVDLDIAQPNRVLAVSDRPILEPGGPGSFDEHGIMPSAVVRDGDRVRLYYSGWCRLAGEAPYHNTTGLAVSEDSGRTFRREFVGPVLDRSPNEAFSATSPCHFTPRGHMARVLFRGPRLDQDRRKIGACL